MKIRVKRIYDGYDENDGARILVDRLWPRGIKKEKARLTAWMKEIAPSSELRKWYCHDPQKWDEFVPRYMEELEAKRELCVELLNYGDKVITLLYASKDTKFNQAVVLKDYLEKLYNK